MALYDTRFGLPQAVADYLNQGLPDIYQNIYNPPSIGPITKMPVESKPLVDPLYPQTGGNAEGFSVYNPDPNMTRTSRNYVNPFPYDPMDDFGTSDYGYVEQPREGITGLLDKYVKGSLPAQLIGKTVRGLANMLPVSKAGIFQNELLGAGFMLDNTGRIVSNNYNTPEGIMAGYNPVSGGALNFLTGGKYGDEPTYGLDKAYDKRRETVANTLRTKYRDQLSDEDIEAALAGEYKGDIPIDPITGKPTTLINRLDLFNKSQNLLNKRKKAADVIFNRKIEERKEKALEKQNQERIARETRQKAEAARKNQTYTGGSDRQNVVDRNTGRRDATGGDRGSKGASDRFSNKSGRGRTGY